MHSASTPTAASTNSKEDQLVDEATTVERTRRLQDVHDALGSPPTMQAPKLVDIGLKSVDPGTPALGCALDEREECDKGSARVVPSAPPPPVSSSVASAVDWRWPSP